MASTALLAVVAVLLAVRFGTDRQVAVREEAGARAGSVDVQAALRGAVNNAAQAAPAGGTVAWIDAPDWQLGLAAGQADIHTGEELTGDEAFHIGSITKTVTATVALQLVEEGILALDEPIAEVVPEHAARFEHGDEITLRQLLGHTSGLADFWDEELDADIAGAASIHDGVVTIACLDPGQKDLLGYAADEQPRFEPGARGEYSNTNYVLAGKLIETATGKPLEDVYRERILEPLDMDHTWLACAEQPRTQRARGYDAMAGPGAKFHDADAAVLDVTDFENRFVSAAGGLVSTREDLAAFARALFAGDLFDEDATLEEMRDPHLLTSEHGPGGRYGLGLEVEDHALGHGGGRPGYNAVLRFYPAQDTVVVALGNQNPVRPPPSAHAAVTAIRTILVSNQTD